MTTKQRKAKGASRTQPLESTVVHPELQDVPVTYISSELIELSPLNYRKFYDPRDLELFAKELAQDGILSSLVLRPKGEQMYEVVVGERRMRGAWIAGLPKVPAQIRDLTDQQVIEMQLAENLYREDPHPMDTARAIDMLLKSGLQIEQVSQRLGKTKKFIYTHMKLASLIDPIQLLFLQGKININEAFEISAIDAGSQQEFFDENCEEWEKENFKLYNLKNKLSRYQYDLSKAPFDIIDKTLSPSAGACLECPFNSAVLQTLFPELAQEAICTKKSCYQHKCQLHLELLLGHAFAQWQPQAIIGQYISENVHRAINGHSGAKELPLLQASEITVHQKPEEPQREKYYDRWPEEGEEPEFYQEDYDQAMVEFAEETELYEQLEQTGAAYHGLLVNDTEIEMVLYDLTKKKNVGKKSALTSKEVHEAIRAGQANEVVLQSEIQRLNQRELRSKELDREKVQVQVHDLVCQQLAMPEIETVTVDADMVACRLIALESMDWATKCRINKLLFESEISEYSDKDVLDKLAQLTDHEHALLIRMALSAKADSKRPDSETGRAVYMIATQLGLEVKAVEDQQVKIREKREARLRERVSEMEDHIAKLPKDEQVSS